MDRPTEINLPNYLHELKKAGVTDIVRICEPTYSAGEVEKQGISMHELPFADGQSPPAEVIESWMKITKSMMNKKGCVAVHCVAGLGRAPVLVAVALINGGLPAVDAVAYIRKERRGAINAPQLKFLNEYEMQVSNSGGCACVIC